MNHRDVIDALLLDWIDHYADEGQWYRPSVGVDEVSAWLRSRPTHWDRVWERYEENGKGKR